MDNPEFQRFHHIVERFINPLGIIKDSRVKKKIVDPLQSYLEDAKGVIDKVKRSYFFQNPKRLNQVLMKLPPDKRFSHCKLIVGITNQEISNSFYSFSAPESKGALDKIMGYGKYRTNSEINNLRKLGISTVSFRLMLSVLIELPAIFSVKDTPSIVSATEDEYYQLGIDIVKPDELGGTITRSLKAAREKLTTEVRAKKRIDVLILRRNNFDMFLNIHIYRSFYELRLSVPSLSNNSLDDFMKEISFLNPRCYYYSPSILRPSRNKICIVGCDTELTDSMNRYIGEIEEITPVNYIGKVG